MVRNIIVVCRRFLLMCILATVCVAQSQPKTIFLVRHAERASDAADSPLSELGHKRAECLAGTLRDALVKAVFVSEFVRTQQTANPLAKQLGLPLTIVNKDDSDGLAQKVRSGPETALIVAHSDTLPTIVQKLGGGTIGAIAGKEYDRLVVLHSNGSNTSSVVILRYCDCAQDDKPTARPSKSNRHK